MIRYCYFSTIQFLILSHIIVLKFLSHGYLEGLLPCERVGWGLSSSGQRSCPVSVEGIGAEGLRPRGSSLVNEPLDGCLISHPMAINGSGVGGLEDVVGFLRL